MRRTLAKASCAAAIALVAAPATASADKVVEALTVWRFDAATYSMDQGERVTLKNSDSASPGPHDVTATAKAPDGKPLFASKRIPAGQTAPVEGAERLRTGTYDFFCTVHPFMEASLVVSSRGTPVAPPGGQPPPGGGPPPPTADRTRPRVEAALARTSLRTALRRDRFTALVTTDELVDLRLSLTARVRGRRVGVGSGAVTHGAPGRRVAFRIRPTAAGERALRRARRATFTLQVQATDRAGNRTRASARRTFTR